LGNGKAVFVFKKPDNTKKREEGKDLWSLAAIQTGGDVSALQKSFYICRGGRDWACRDGERKRGIKSQMANGDETKHFSTTSVRCQKPGLATKKTWRKQKKGDVLKKG